MLIRNKIDIQYIERIKHVTHITTDMKDIKKIEHSNKYVYNEADERGTLNFDMFGKYKTIIVKSCTGTGETTAIAQHLQG